MVLVSRRVMIWPRTSWIDVTVSEPVRTHELKAFSIREKAGNWARCLNFSRVQFLVMHVSVLLFNNQLHEASK